MHFSVDKESSLLLLSTSGSLLNINLIRTEKQCDGWKQYVTLPATFRRGKKKVPFLQTDYSLFNYLKIDKSAKAKRISSQMR
jgi:hypothetical protein